MGEPFPSADWFEVPYRLRMGLAALGPDAPWLEIDANTAGLLERKRQILADHRPQTSLALAGSEPAQREALAVVEKELRRHRLARPGTTDARSPLEEAALLVPEDLCLMEPGDAGWVLTAACVCFPTRWDLPSKMGLSLSEVHAAVPGYAGPLAESADGFFERMKPGRVFERRNWSLLEDPELYQPEARRGGSPDGTLSASNAGERVWIRVERQTLRRLPDTGAVLFSIRIHQDRLAAVGGRPRAATALAASIRSMSPDFAEYKALGPIRDAVLGYADAIVGPAAPENPERAC